MNKGEKITQIKRRFRNEWLLIKVTEYDKNTSTCLKGKLLAHSPNRDDIYHKAISHKGHTLIDYSGGILPKDYAVAF